MFEFSKRSQNNLETCHPNLIELMEYAIKSSPIDFSIICGYRNKEDQEKAFMNKTSKVHYPDSKHNANPSIAVDIQPYPYTKEDRKADKRGEENTKFKQLTYYIEKIAKELDIPIINGGLKWGWDWYHWQLIV